MDKLLRKIGLNDFETPAYKLILNGNKDFAESCESNKAGPPNSSPEGLLLNKLEKRKCTNHL